MFLKLHAIAFAYVVHFLLDSENTNTNEKHNLHTLLLTENSLWYFTWKVTMLALTDEHKIIDKGFIDNFMFIRLYEVKFC